MTTNEWTLIKAQRPANEWQPWPSHFIHFPIPRQTALGYFNPRSARFGLRYSLTAGPAGRTGHLGFRGVVPLVGNWRGGPADGTGYYDPRYATFHLMRAGAHGRNIKARFGPKHMIPLVGDSKARANGIGYYDPATGAFYLRQSKRFGPADFTFKFGPPHMIPPWSETGTAMARMAWAITTREPASSTCATRCGTDRQRSRSGSARRT